MSAETVAFLDTARRLRGRNNEGYLAAIIVAFLLVVTLVAPGTVTTGMLADVLRGSIVNLALALGLILIIISGGIDVSFTAIAIFSGYATVLLMRSAGFDDPWTPFAVATGIGTALGVLNAALVAGLGLPTLIATLGTQGMIRGALLAFVGSNYISTLPPRLGALGESRLATVGGSAVATLTVPVLILAVVVALTLRFTVFGRTVYAIGGNTESARRAGIKVRRTCVAIYLLAGALSGFAGMVHVTLAGHASPYELVGTELNVIAGVVIGGALDTGGRGSVGGVVLGVVLISLIQNSLVRLGVPGFWQGLAVGLIILLGVLTQAQASRHRHRRAVSAAGSPA